MRKALACAVAVILALSACGEHSFSDEFLEAPSSEVSSSGGDSSSNIAVSGSSSSVAQNLSSSSSIIVSSSSDVLDPSSSSSIIVSSSSSSDAPSSSSSVAQNLSSSSSIIVSSSSSSDILGSSSSSSIAVSSSSSSNVLDPSSSSSIIVSSSSSSDAPSSSSSLATSSSSVVYCEDFKENETRLHYKKQKRQICDKRDGTKYVYVTIGTQDWLAENLRIAKDKNGKSIGRCYEDKPENCEIYGRLYIIADEMCVDCPLKNELCPDGWHIPSGPELSIMLKFVDPQYQEGSEGTGLGNNESGVYLKTTSGWAKAAGVSPDNPNGTDKYGFSALPGGYCGGGCPDDNPVWTGLGSISYWWTTSQGKPAPLSITWNMNGHYHVNDAMQSYPFSKFYARCVRD